MKHKYRIVLTETKLGDIIIDTDKEIPVDALKRYACQLFKDNSDKINWVKQDYEINAVYDLKCSEKEDEFEW